MLEINSDTRLVLREEIIIQVIPELDHYYLFNVENGDHFQLNHSACWILEKAGDGVAFGELLQLFANEFDLSQEQAHSDLSEVIDFALDNHIIKEVSS